MRTASEGVVLTSTVLVPFTASSVGAARRELSSELRARHVPEHVVDDAVLVLSEILSNALKHARPLPSGRLRVRWTTTPRSVQVAVTDGGAPTRPHAGTSTMSATGGRGLGIVDDLASDWGVLDEAGTITVWAVVDDQQQQGGGAARR
ncbi:ATP-binding protein [Vallicoccus soli]|uniref:ATP-binding protein n=1 Tax=Vallicoccus soli TaxID=2339232 RepID=A0A3A3YVX1_9ACTN|nr:ATP-binding protein [Vallicoccus soli]RJK94837.1 ATP-binding protein [Vallicoccus soli]